MKHLLADCCRALAICLNSLLGYIWYGTQHISVGKTDRVQAGLISSAKFPHAVHTLGEAAFLFEGFGLGGNPAVEQAAGHDDEHQ